MTDFVYQELLPLGADDTPYRLLTTDGVSSFEAGGERFLRVDPEVITLLTRQAMRDIAHLLRPGHLAQLSSILDDPEASANDRFVALELLKNASIAAGGILPSCQDTGTAIVKGKKGQYVVTGGGDEAAIAQGIFETYRDANLRYSQMAPLTMWDEVNTKTNLPAEIKISAVDGDAYKFLFMAKGGGSANKSYLFQETKALLNPARLAAFLDDKLRSLGTAACPPYHLAVVIGGTSAELAVETAKLASTKYLDTLPTSGNGQGRGFRDLELEASILVQTQAFGIGAQFGGKYFCHDVRVIRLPRHGASCPGWPHGGGPRHRPRQDLRTTGRGSGHAPVPEGLLRLLRRPGQDARGLREWLLRPHDCGTDGLLRRAVPGRRRLDGHARQGQPLGPGDLRVCGIRRVLPRLHRWPGRPARPGLHQVRCGP
jgi:fumarate hydratase class I